MLCQEKDNQQRPIICIVVRSKYRTGTLDSQWLARHLAFCSTCRKIAASIYMDVVEADKAFETVKN
jgi:hypothetical protein